MKKLISKKNIVVLQFITWFVGCILVYTNFLYPVYAETISLDEVEITEEADGNTYSLDDEEVINNEMEGAETEENYTYEDAISQMVNVLLSLLSGIGFLLIIWSAIMFMGAVAHEEADVKARAVSNMMAGIMLLAIKNIFTLAGLTA